MWYADMREHTYWLGCWHRSRKPERADDHHLLVHLERQAHELSELRSRAVVAYSFEWW